MVVRAQLPSTGRWQAELFQFRRRRAVQHKHYLLRSLAASVRASKEAVVQQQAQGANIPAGEVVQLSMQMVQALAAGQNQLQQAVTEAYAAYT